MHQIQTTQLDFRGPTFKRGRRRREGGEGEKRVREGRQGEGRREGKRGKGRVRRGVGMRGEEKGGERRGDGKGSTT